MHIIQIIEFSKITVCLDAFVPKHFYLNEFIWQHICHFNVCQNFIFAPTEEKSSMVYTNFSGQWDKIVPLLFRTCLIVWNCIYKNTDTDNINKLKNLKRQTKHFFKIIFNTSTTYHIQDRKDIVTQAWSKTERKVGKISLKNFKVLIFSNHIISYKQ